MSRAVIFILIYNLHKPIDLRTSKLTDCVGLVEGSRGNTAGARTHHIITIQLPLSKLHLSKILLMLFYSSDRAVAHRVSRRLPTAETQVLALVRSCGIYGGQSGSGQAFTEYVLRFPLSLIHSTNCVTIITIYLQGWYKMSINCRNDRGLCSSTSP
jgi:hypothetical protein